MVLLLRQSLDDSSIDGVHKTIYVSLIHIGRSKLLQISKSDVSYDKVVQRSGQETYTETIKKHLMKH